MKLNLIKLETRPKELHPKKFTVYSPSRNSLIHSPICTIESRHTLPSQNSYEKALSRNLIKSPRKEQPQNSGIMIGNQVSSDGLSLNITGTSKNQLYDIMEKVLSSFLMFKVTIFDVLVVCY